MADDNLEILILARDEASKTIKSIGNSMKGAFKTGALIATGGLALFTAGLGGMIALGIKGERVQAQLNAVLASTGGVAGMTAGEVNSLADELSRVTPFSQDAIVSAESLLLTFTNIGEDVFPQATEAVLNMATVFGSTDQASIQLGKALNDPIQGISALQRVGVSFTDEQKKMVEQLVKTGDLEGAQAVILGELEKEFGGAARAAGDTFGGKLAILKNKLMDVVETLGMAMLPALTGIVDLVLDHVLPAFESFGEKVRPGFEYAAILAERFTAVLKQDGLIAALETLFFVFENGAGPISTLLQKFGVGKNKANELSLSIHNLVTPFLEFIQNAAIPFVQEHMPAIKAALIAVGAVLAGAAIVGGILSIVGAIAALANPITLIILGIALLAAAWTEDWGGIRTYITDTVWPALLPILTTIRDWLSVNLPIAISLLKLYWNTVLLPALLGLVDFWNDTLKPVLAELAMWLAVHLPLWIAWLKDKWETVLIPALQAVVDFWNDTLKPAFDAIKSWLETTIPVAMIFAKNAWVELQNKMNDLHNYWTLILQPKFETIKAWLDTTIPLAMGFAKDAWSELKDKMADIKAYWDDTLKPVFDAIMTMLQTTLDTGVQDALGFLDSLKGGFNDLWGAVDSVVGAIGDVLDEIINLWENIPDVLKPGSPPPFAVGIGLIAEEMRNWNREMLALQTTMNATPPGMGLGGASTATTNNNQQYNLIVNSNARAENVRSQFNTMRTWGRI